MKSVLIVYHSLTGAQEFWIGVTIKLVGNQEFVDGAAVQIDNSVRPANSPAPTPENS